MQIETQTDPANPDLVALVGSRICHDLTSPLGAIGNGVELLALSGAPQGAEMRLIAESVASAQARIRLFRLAFGAATEGQSLPGPEIEAILASLSAGGRIRCIWRAGAQALRAEVKLAFLALLCVETALPRGGEICIGRIGARWRVEGAGPQVRLDPGLTAWLTAPARAGQVSAAHVQFALIVEETRRQGRALTGNICRGDSPGGGGADTFRIDF